MSHCMASAESHAMWDNKSCLPKNGNKVKETNLWHRLLVSYDLLLYMIIIKDP